MNGTVVIFAIIWAVTGFGIAKLNDNKKVKNK